MGAVKALSAKCDTSLTATAIRYAQRTCDAVAIIVSEGNILRYCFMSEEMKQIPGLTWPRKNSSLPRNTATHRFNSHKNNVLGRQEAECDTSLSDWFGCNRTYEIYEEVVGLGSYERTLTVLSIDDMPDEQERAEVEDLQDSWTPRFKR